jgi:hypothetical protein
MPPAGSVLRKAMANTSTVGARTNKANQAKLGKVARIS